jgi:hypothetical protein
MTRLVRLGKAHEVGGTRGWVNPNRLNSKGLVNGKSDQGGRRIHNQIKQIKSNQIKSDCCYGRTAARSSPNRRPWRSTKRNPTVHTYLVSPSKEVVGSRLPRTRWEYTPNGMG